MPSRPEPYGHLIRTEMKRGHSAARSERIPAIRYGGHTVRLKTGSSRGYQESLFQDEIVGNSQIWVERDLTQDEQAFLKKTYPNLATAEHAELVRRLTRIHTGEMVAFYVQRYGFYEGHTDYRADPVALAWIFGLRTLPQVEKALPGKLPELLVKPWRRPRGKAKGAR